jgi:hypothetical protein
MDLCPVRFLDLPKLKPERLQRAVALGAYRWFLKSGSELVTTAVQDGTGRTLAAATNAPLLRSVVDRLPAARVRCDAIVPAATTIAAVLGDGTFFRKTDAGTAGLAVRQGSLIDHCAGARCHPIAPLPVPTGLDSLGSDGTRYLPAYAAATTPGDLAFPIGDPSIDKKHRVRLAIAMPAVGVVLWMAAAAVHVVHLVRLEDAAVARIQVLAQQVEAVTRLQNETDALAQRASWIERLHRRDSHDRLLVGTLTSALPSDAHLTSLRRSGSDQVVISGYAQRATGVVAQLTRAPGISSPEIVGSVTREAIGGVGRERFEMRFTWDPKGERL